MHLRYRTVVFAALALFVQQAQADIVDLTVSGSQQGEINGAKFLGSILQPTGTGVFNTFLRVQETGSNKDGIEKGFNTDANPTPFDDKNDPHTHSLLLSQVPLRNVGGVFYREFRLDVAEPNDGTAALISLDQLKIYLQDDPALKESDFTGNFNAPIYDMDAGPGGDSYVNLNSGLAPGNGKSNMSLLVPDSLFVGDKYVYLFSEFGVPYTAEGSFEEWGVDEGGGDPRVPTPGAALLGLIGLGLVGRLKRAVA